MSRIILASALAAMILTGCATTILGGIGGDRERLQNDLMACSREKRAFLWIPDGGITFELNRDKCMRRQHWVRKGGWTWIWTGGMIAPLPPPSAWDTGL